MGNLEEDKYKAIEYFTKAIELDSNLSEAYSSRAEKKQLLGDLKGAMLDYNIAIELDPKDFGVYINRGTLKYNQSNYRGAKLDYLIYREQILDCGFSIVDCGLRIYKYTFRI